MAGQIRRQHCPSAMGETSCRQGPDRVIHAGAMHHDDDRRSGLERPPARRREGDLAVDVELHPQLPFWEVLSAWIRSSTMSGAASRPTERRTRSSPTPEAASSSALIWEWVVLAGWITKVLASPTLARWEARRRASMNFRPASRPPLTPKVIIEPAPLG